MLSKANALKIFFSFLALTLFTFSRLSYADWSVGVNFGGPGYHHDDRHFYRWHEHPQYGLRMHFLPDGYLTMVGQLKVMYSK